MNRLIIISILLLQVVGLSAQDIVSSFLDKHGKDSNLELTTIGKKMFRTMEEEGLINERLSSIVSGLDCIHIISSADASLAPEYFSSSVALLEKESAYRSVYQSGGVEDIQVAVRESSGTIRELIIIAGGESSFDLVCLSGDIALDALTAYSEDEGLETLKNIIPNQYNK